MYCGRCGGFYNPACQHWPLCSPAPNPHEPEDPAAMVMLRSAFKTCCTSLVFMTLVALAASGLASYIIASHGG